ncbi:hypothetical protein NPIL_164151 [Nephila pilipes]|uniref:Uncharacterized protein n=1 Tax=Nephila pilipes TaxID=299642 RepID=A0A8X6T8T9_NEPPI|nr:hypothetical protein NPIL_164151 [Nephila pilipes]
MSSESASGGDEYTWTIETFDDCSKPNCTNCLMNSGVVSNLDEFKLYLKPAQDIDVNKVAQDPNNIPAKFLFSKPNACDCAEKNPRQQEEKSNRVQKDSSEGKKSLAKKKRSARKEDQKGEITKEEVN